MLNNTKVSDTGSMIVQVPREHEIFTKSPVLRLLREIWLELGEDTAQIGAVQAKMLCMELKDGYKKSIVANLRRIVILDKESKRFKMLDPASYSDAIMKNVTKESAIQNAVTQLRDHVKNLENYIVQLSGHDFRGTKGYEFAQGLSQVFKFRRAIRKIYNNPEILAYVYDKEITSSEDLQEVLLSAGIGNVNKTIEEFAAVLEEESRKLLPQLNIIKSFVKEADPEVYTAIETLSAEKLPKIGDVVDFTRNFRNFYVSIRENEDFLKIDGLTEDLANSINTILGTSNMLNKLGMGTFNEESQAMLQNIAKSTLEINATKLKIAYRVAGPMLPRVILGNKETKFETPELEAAARYILLVGVYATFDISGGTLALNMLDKLTK
ncbi:MAG: hypothetical protein ACRC0Y_03580 [Fusobacteriaceae bacterium]